MRPTMKKMEARTQSPEPTRTSRPVPRVPRPTKVARNLFLPRMMSETVPRIGDSTATITRDTLSVTVHSAVACAGLPRVDPATWL